VQNLNAKRPLTMRIKARRRTLRLRAQPILRCPICMAAAAELPVGFRCEVKVCPGKFQRITVQNGVAVK